MTDWAELPPEILFLIAKKLTVWKDFVGFRAVCTSWRSVATEEDFNSGSKIPWLMLADKKSTHMREFYNLITGEIYNFPLREVKAKRFYTSKNWIITIGKDWKINMVHPITRSQINLPHMSTFENFEDLKMPNTYADFIWKVVLSSSPCCASNYVVMVVHGWRRKLAFCRPRDNIWTTIETYWCPYSDAIYYKGQFYAIDYWGIIIVCDVEGHNPRRGILVSRMPEGLVYFIEKLYLVESRGKLLVVSREGQQRREDDLNSVVRSNFTTRFQVFEVNLSSKNNWTEVKSLGNTALFLGHNSSFSVDVTNNPGCKNDCIYFTDDFFEAYRGTREGGGRDMGIYHMQDGSIEPHYKGESFSQISPPLWIEPSF